jgi:hypothetical protein
LRGEHSHCKKLENRKEESKSAVWYTVRATLRLNNNGAMDFCNPDKLRRDEARSAASSFSTAAPPRAPQSDDHVIETGLAEEMNALTVAEREQVYDEIHGVADVIEETPQFVSTSLFKMREELARLPRRSRIILDRAVFLKPGIVIDDRFHMMFLRACRFDPKEAAHKMSRFFVHKLELFGDEKLVQDITLDDLGEYEMQHMYDGVIQFPRINDRGMRAQYYMLSANHPVPDEHWKSFLRYQFYQLMAVLEDEEVQKRGIVEMSNLCGKSHHSFRQLLTFGVKAKDFFNDRPVKVCAFHVLYDQSHFVQFLTSISGMMKTDLRLRQRFHFGSEMEIQYELLTFGIKLPKSCFKLGQGIFTRSHIDAYLEQRRQREITRKRQEAEAAALRPNRALCPIKEDVIMGRGRPYQRWPGNKRLAQLVLDNTERYMQTSYKKDKTVIASDIVRNVQANGGRFIVRATDDWEKVDDVPAREKVSQLLRAEARSRQQPIKAPRISPNSSIDGSHNNTSSGDESQSKRRRFA